MDHPETTFCCNCQAWERLLGTEGVCRRRAPSVVLGHVACADCKNLPADAARLFAAWPKTVENDFCCEGLPLPTCEARLPARDPRPAVQDRFREDRRGEAQVRSHALQSVAADRRTDGENHRLAEGARGAGDAERDFGRRGRECEQPHHHAGKDEEPRPARARRWPICFEIRMTRTTEGRNHAGAET